MSEIEKMMQNANVAKPVIKKWYYDGYYEDFSWKSSEEDCTKLLKYFDNSIDKLNDRIQQMKKEENTKYDRYTDSIYTEFGRVEKAYIIYPPFTAEKQIELIKWLAQKDYYTCDYCEIEPRKNGQEWLSYCHFKGSTSNTFENALAGLINEMWQDLTEEEKASIKNILEM